MSFNKSFFLSQSEINKIKTTIANHEGTIESMVSDQDVYDYIDDHLLTTNQYNKKKDLLLTDKNDIAGWLIDASTSTQFIWK